ncbi:MAG: hypothetical protein ACLUQ6_06030 [Alistipes onderdonkii]
MTFDCTETQTKNLEIELNGKLNWQIKADAWIELSQTSGKRFGNSSRNRPRERHFAYGYHHRNGHRLHGRHRHGHVLRKADQGRVKRIRMLRNSAGSSRQPTPLPMEKN